MNRAERIYRLHALLKAKPRSLAQLQEELEASRATVVRDLGYLRDFMGTPIEYDRATNGYRYRPSDFEFELPGLCRPPRGGADCNSVMAAPVSVSA